MIIKVQRLASTYETLVTLAGYLPYFTRLTSSDIRSIHLLQSNDLILHTGNVDFPYDVLALLLIQGKHLLSPVEA